MSFGEAIKSVFQNYVNFSGRARRSEYWYFALFSGIIGFVFGFIEGVLGESMLLAILSVVVSLGLLLPSLSVSVRRLHDIGKSGWWILIQLTIVGIIPMFIWFCRDSQPGENQYGLNPKEIS